jgi:transcriptional regulator of nitric oxide reductase
MTVGMAVMALGSVSASPQLDAPAVAAGCARQFETAQRIDMESFRDYDAQTFRDGHHRDAVTVFASGTVRYGIDAIMAALASHFTNREAVWAWTELYRVVDGCKSAFILYDTTYDIPSSGFHQHALTGVTYTHRHGKWLAIADQGTLLP